MATPSEARAVKSLNKSSGGRRFVFKTFSQRIEEIDIDVYRSLDPLKAEPSQGSSFFRDCLVEYRELNTAEDFISIYEEIFPLVQTLPQIILQKDLIVSSLLSRLKMEGRLSHEPILRLIAALSRDLLEDFIPFLRTIADSLECLLQSGADRDPEIIEQIFTSWSYIMMYLQKYLIKDVGHVLRITAKLRYYPKDYVREFMAESVSFLLRKTPVQQLKKGITKLMGEVVDEPSELRKSGVGALLSHVMRITSSKLHSRAETLIPLLVDESSSFDHQSVEAWKQAFRIHLCNSASGSRLRSCSRSSYSGLQRLYAELDPVELTFIWKCLCNKITDCVPNGKSLHLSRLLTLLISVVQNDYLGKISDYQTMVELVGLLLTMKIVDPDSEIIDKILQLMLCIVDVLTTELPSFFRRPHTCSGYSLLTFIEDLLMRDPSILNIFGTHILCAFNNLIEVSAERVLNLMMNFCEKLGGEIPSFLDGKSREKLSRIHIFFEETLRYWFGQINEAIEGNLSPILFQQNKLAVLWGIIRICWWKVLDALDIFAENLCHAHKEIRLSTLRILCYYEPIYYEHSKKEQAVDSNTIIDVCETSHADDPHNNVLNLLRAIEETPFSIATSRRVILLISKIQMGLSAHRIAEQYMPVILNGIIGIFHNRFSYLWNPALECLTVLIRQYSRMVWDRFVKYLEHGQLVFLTSHEQHSGGDNDSDNDTGLVGRFNYDIFPLFDSTPCTTVLSLLIQSLQKVPSIAESNSHQIIPLFLKFLGYNADENTSDVAAYTLDHKGKEWKGILKEWLSLFRLLRNPKLFHQGQFFKDVLQYRLLDQKDADIQMKVLDCLLNWRDDFLLPYSEHLKNLINTKYLREELTRWSLSTKSTDAIDVRHRAYIVPIVIQILTPKVRNLKMLGCQKNASVHHRRAVLGFLTQLDVTELPVFFWLLIKPLSISERDDAFLKSFSSLFSSPKDEFDMSDILKHFTTDTVKALSWKKRYGFLHVVEDILAVFDESHLNPFLDLLMNCVVRILASCTSSGGSTNSRGLSSVQNCLALTWMWLIDEVEDEIKAVICFSYILLKRRTRRDSPVFPYQITLKVFPSM
ncbi:Small subunit processome component 20, partial [Sesamum angolense]